MLKEFKEFAIKGNMLDMAVGVIIGSAFSGLVTALVNSVIMPLLSVFTGKLESYKMAPVVQIQVADLLRVFHRMPSAWLHLPDLAALFHRHQRLADIGISLPAPPKVIQV